MDLNKEQLKAVQTIDQNLVVNAGAGTGKTKVLTDRFIYILDQGDLEKYKEIESIVAITFTNKATQEMVERIRNEIKKNIVRGEKWTRFYRDLEKANISTIHGFCAKILRENPMEAKVDPYFEILDDVTSNQILKESILQVLNKKLEISSKTFNMMKLLNKNKIEDLVQDINSLYNEIRTVGLSFKEVKGDTIKYINSLEFKEEYVQEIKDLIEHIMNNSRSNAKILKIRDSDLWIDFKSGNHKEDIYTYIEHIKGHLGNNTKLQEEVDRANYLLDLILLTKEKDYLWVYDILTDILIDIDHSYTSKKTELGSLDYDDLQNKLVKLLDNKEILRKYQDKYRYFMIDEFQDTNELQKKIFYKLASVKEPLDRQNLFIVGDPKQSIYGFRGADIDVFYSVLDDINDYGKDNAVTLKMNYRSFNTILDFVNKVFSPIMENKYDELLFFKKSQNEIDIELLQDDNIEGTSEEITYYEADIIAKRIKKLVNEGRYNYRDIALLFRSSTRNHVYEEALKDYNIPYYNSSSKKFFHRQEILDILNGLKTISNPYDKISTIGFLRSPMVGLKDTTIYWLLKYLTNNIYETILEMKGNPIFLLEEKIKLDSLSDLLKDFYEFKNRHNIIEILDLLLEKTMFIETSLLKSEGSQILANIYKFKEMTNEYYEKNNNSLEDYIDYIEKLKDTSESEGITQSEEDDVVKLITIHSSKGLQFPVVIIPEMAKRSGGSQPTMVYKKDIGIGIKTKESQGTFNIINDNKKEREREEDSRVLYVAMTRAEEMLILGCFGGNSGFKNMIKEFLPENKYREISDIEVDKEDYIPVKSIDKDLIKKPNKSYSEIQNSLPLLYQINSYNTKDFISYNISQYQKFYQCKRQFFLDYYWGLNMVIDHEDDKIEDIEYTLEMEEDTNLIKANEKGNIVHEFCNMYRIGMDKESLLIDIVRSYGIDYGEDLRDQLMPYIDNYISYHSEEYDAIYSERPFHLKVGNKYIKGIIDRITVKGEKIEILDFKTNKLWKKNKLIEFYRPQLQLYAYAVEKIMGKKIYKSSILFLENGFKAEIDISSECLEDNFNNIKEFIEYVETHKDIDSYEQSPECNEYCLYKGFCFN